MRWVKSNKHVLVPPSAGGGGAEFVWQFQILALYAAVLVKLVLNAEVKS